MKHNFTHYYYMISCPSDMQDELEIITSMLDELNMTFGEENGINIKALYWKKNTRPEVGEDGQSIINKQLLNKADGIIALFWTKFGTPTAKYGSGTEEEIEKAILQNKDVMLYFSNKPINPQNLDNEQYNKVINFKKKYSGLFCEYNSLNDFKEIINRHLLDLFTHLSSQDKMSNTYSQKNELTLTEIFEVGFFTRRFLIELPVTAESIGVFLSRIDLTLQLASAYELLNSNEISTILLTKNNASNKGAYSLSTEDIQKTSNIFLNLEILLMKKLREKENATFQIGRSLGHILMLTEIKMSSSTEAKISDLFEDYPDAIDNFIERAIVAGKYLNNDIHEIVEAVKEIYTEPTHLCSSAVNSVRLAIEKISTILPLLK